MSRIISIGTAVPDHRTDQGAILEFMHAAYEDETASRKLNVLFNHSGISSRYSVLPDFDKSRQQHVFFNGTPSTANVENRIDVFKQKAVPLAMAAIDEAYQAIGKNKETFKATHLITVTCTGLSAPGLDADIMEKLDLPDDIYRVSVNFLGCNAAFHAIKLADMICASEPSAKVLVVCVELCTLHFQPKDNHDNLLSNTIFGDGAAALLITSDKAAKARELKGLSLEGSYGLLLKEGKELMGWNITPQTFEMILSAKIPEFIGEHVDSILQKTGKKLNIDISTIHKWAIHPGGKKILDTISKQLQIPSTEMEPSYKVLKEYGNMSSPTVLFVLKELLEQGLAEGEQVFSIGFGPGLSIETAVFSYAK
jgi:predicted naringenin-chalcone synthase